MKTKNKRGFANMDPELQRSIARMGGTAAHKSGTAHEFTSKEARIAGKKGGMITSKDKSHMSRIGVLGGKTRWEKAKKSKNKYSGPVA